MKQVRDAKPARMLVARLEFEVIGAEGGSRTRTTLRSTDFKCCTPRLSYAAKRNS